MLHVRADGDAESLLAAFHEVAASAAMHVHLDAARYDIATFCVNDFCPNDVKVTVGHGLDGVVLDDYRPIVEPATWSEYTSVDNLF